MLCVAIDRLQNLSFLLLTFLIGSPILKKAIVEGYVGLTAFSKKGFPEG